MCHMSNVTCHMSGAKCHMSRVTSHVSHVMCPMSRVTCRLSHAIKFFIQIFFFSFFFFVCFFQFFPDKVVELVGGGSAINGAYPVSLYGRDPVSLGWFYIQRSE